MLVQSYTLISVFPYSGFMAMQLLNGDKAQDDPSIIKPKEAGYYAGYLASSFMAGRTFSSYSWGKAADMYGRKFVLMISLSASCFFGLIFGFSSSFKMAIATRFLMGFFNAIPGTIKTLISELGDIVIESENPQDELSVEQKKEKSKIWEQNTMGFVFGMWGYGFLLGPAISGALSEPTKLYPDSKIVGFLDSVVNLEKFPFVLPNILGSILSLMAAVLCYTSFEETLSREKIKRLPCCRPGRGRRYKRLKSDAQQDEDNNDEEIELGEIEFDIDNNTGDGKSAAKPMVVDAGETLQPATMMSLLRRPTTRKVTLIYASFSFITTTADEMFPLFCLAEYGRAGGGLGLIESSIGEVLFGAGLIYIIFQYAVFKRIVAALGREKALVVGTFLSGPWYFILSFAVFMRNGGTEDKPELLPEVWLFLCAMTGFIRVFSSVHFGTITLLGNECVPAHQRATFNGFSMLAGSLAKMAGPAFAGNVFAFCVNHINDPRVGAVISWMTLSSIAVFVGYQAIQFEKMARNQKAKAAKMDTQ